MRSRSTITDNRLTPEKPLERIDSPLFHWQEGDGRGCVIGGVSGIQLSQSQPAVLPINLLSESQPARDTHQQLCGGYDP